MTRNDARLVLVIVATALCSATGTVAVRRWLEPPPRAAKVAPVPRVDLTPIENRLADLEVRLAALEPVKTCDEDSCVLDGYGPPCCARFDHRLPAAIDRGMIDNAMRESRSPIMACGARVGDVQGQVLVRVKTEPDGTVSSVSVMNTPDTELSSCVVEQVQLASFARTQTGGTFTYSFEF
jgi:hypothetical protein